MWHCLTLTLLLVVTMARSSSSSSNGSTLCPENCRCVIIAEAHPDNEIIDDDKNEKNKNNEYSFEVHCNGTPNFGYLPENIRSLVIRGIESHETASLIFHLENTQKIAISELGLVNCSLTGLSLQLGRLAKNHEFPLGLNLAMNDISEIRELRITDAARLSRLDLTLNRLSRVRSESFVECRELLRLCLSKNIIRTIEKNGFTGLASLESLDISDNRLVVLDDDTFVSLCRLKCLNLSGNSLTILGQRWFDNLRYLRRLDVSRNVREPREPEVKIGRSSVGSSSSSSSSEITLILGSAGSLEMIDASWIGLERVPATLTRSVRFLELAGNRLAVIRDGDFDGYPLLRVLVLARNMIDAVENDALGRLEFLEILDLTGNRLFAMPQSLPRCLRRLLLSENRIVSLRRRDLADLGRLESLEIVKNRLRTIEEGSMLDLSLLGELDISDNPIERLPPDTFDGAINLVYLRMSRLAELKWERSGVPEIAFPVSSPERLAHLDLSDSPVLAGQFLADEAALTASKSLLGLNIQRTNITRLRYDLPYLLPQLRSLGLSGNGLSCDVTDENRIDWLVRWIREHEEIMPAGECTYENGTRMKIRELAIVVDLATSASSARDNANETLGPSASRDMTQRRTHLASTRFGIFILAGGSFCLLAFAAASLIAARRRFGPMNEELLERYEQRRAPIVIGELW